MTSRQILHNISLKFSKRLFHSTKCRQLSLKDVQEVKIPVPWGHIAGRWWGNQNIVPVIALHGMQDNAATFDGLAPLLEVPSFLSLDIPGHGFSSHIPKGLTLHYLDNILYLRYILTKHFKWDKDLVLLGHSFGASLWFTYSALFPSVMNKFISIESAMFNMAMMSSKTTSDMRKSIDAIIDFENQVPKERSFDDLLTYMLEIRSRNFPLSEKAGRIILSRGCKQLDNGNYIFSTDPRLSVKYLGRLNIDFILELSSRIEGHVLNIRATGGIPTGDLLEPCNKSLSIMKNSAKSLEDIFVDGGHHVHLENPEVVAPIINKFINS